MIICEDHAALLRGEDCPYCRIAELREALEEIANSNHLGNSWARHKAKEALEVAK